MESFNPDLTEEEQPKQKSSFFKKLATLAAIGLTAFSPAEAQENETRDQTSALEQIDKNPALTEALKTLGNPSLSVGARKILAIKNTSRGVGIYVDGEHIGDVYSRPMQPFDADVDYFLYQVQQLLDETSQKYTPIKHEELSISPEAILKMDELGIVHTEETNAEGKRMLVLTFNSSDRIEMDISSDGDPTTYGKLTTYKGTLIFSGVDQGEPYHVTITKGSDGKIAGVMRSPGPQPIVAE